MTDVFISYSQQRWEVAEPLVQLFKEAGFSCWLDRDLLDDNFEKEITKQLKAAKAVVVIWSLESINSDSVLDEASWAKRKHKLVNVHLPEIKDPREDIPDRLAERINSIGYAETDRIITAIKRRLTSPEVAPTDAQIAAANDEAGITQLLVRFPKYAGQIALRAKEAGLVRVESGAVNGRAVRWLRPGEQLRDLPYLPKLVIVPHGRFKMGAPDGEDGSRKDERPIHQVTISKPIAVARCPVTVGEWEEARSRGFEAPPQPTTDRLLPATHVSWSAAKAYTAWLRRQTGLYYRLLSEAEWEYCCRADTNGPFAVKRANFNSSYTKRGEFVGEALERVGQEEPNAFGVCDMQGKVWEWVEDDYHFSYNRAPTDGSPWCDAKSDNHKVIRGGCYASGQRHIRAARRTRCFVTPREPGKIGFRVARPV